MKTLTHLLLFSLLFSSTFALIAQPTLSRTANFPAVGDAFSRINCDTVGVSAGAAGANQTWNFSSLQQAASFQSGDFVLPSTTDFASDFQMCIRDRVLAIELLTAAQALSLRKKISGLESSQTLENLLDEYRQTVPFLTTDRLLHTDLDASVLFVQNNLGKYF